MQLRDCVDLYFREAPDLAPKTRKKIGYEINRWEKVTLGPPVERITKETFAQFRAGCIAKGLAARTIETNIDTVRILLAASVEEGWRSSVPPVGRRLKRPKPRPNPLTADQVRALFIHAEVSVWPNHVFVPRQWWRAFFVLTFWTGLRLEDVCWKLRWDHINVRRERIEFPAGKTGHIHEFPLPMRAIPHLARVSTSGLVLGPPHSMKCFRRELRSIVRASGIDRKVTPKNMRQTAVTEWSKVSRDAGRIVHGCGLGDVRDFYVNPLSILDDAAPRMPWPFPDDVCQRQLRLF